MADETRDAPPSPPGPGVDAFGQAIRDPSENVMGLVRAESRRQDDLREAEKIHLREVLELRAAAGKHERECGEEIAALHSTHNAEMVTLRATYDHELRKSEADHINAIRAVDVGNVQRAAEVQATQATTLANQVTATADAMRTQLAAALEPIQKDIADLRRAQYEAQGQKTQVVETQSKGASIGLWVGMGVAVLLAVMTLVVSIAVALSAGP